MKEPQIEINGYTLTYVQAMAVRVAIEHFRSELYNPDFCSDLGSLALEYRTRLAEVSRLILMEKTNETARF